MFIHKLEEAEEKFDQTREYNAMLEEDFCSNVVRITESIVEEEETEALLDSLREKNPECYKIVNDEIELCQKLSKISLDLKAKEEMHKDLAAEIAE